MAEVEGHGRPPSRVFLGFLIALSLLALIFIGLGMHRANRCTLRGDEIVTLFGNWRGASWSDLALRGAGGQVSPAPLLYIVDKLADQARVPLKYLGLTPPGYVRLPSLLFTAGLGFAAALAVARKLRAQDGGGTALQYFFVLCGLATFYFHLKVFSFACIERPYGLWNGLWMVLLAWLLGRPPVPRVPMILLTLMAATATAACFQILAVGIALVVVRRMEHRSAKEILREGALLLALPAAVGVYYAIRSQDAAVEDRRYDEVAPHFLRFWMLTNWHVWIAGGTISALALTRPKLRDLAIPPVAVTVLLLLMPLMFTLAHQRGYAMVSRQYIWTTTALPLAFFFTAVAWPELRPPRVVRPLAIATSLLIVGGNIIATFTRPALRHDSRELAMLDSKSPLMIMLRSERPRSFAVSTALGDIEEKNLELIGEWIRIRYGHLPANRGIVWVREEEGRLEATPGPFQHSFMMAIPLDR